MPNPFGAMRRQMGAFLTNLEAGPPWPAKIVPLVRNRTRALRGGCCGNPGQPGC
jgi:hypothetical protein